MGGHERLGQAKKVVKRAADVCVCVCVRACVRVRVCVFWKGVGI